MPARAFRPYAFNRPAAQAKINLRRADDPIRKLYKTKTWRATRLVVLFRDPVCKLCDQAPSTICDHVISARKYLADHGVELHYFFDESNLQGVCQPCHDGKTAVESGFAGF
jgi:5-methylcytosine-specific restriction endonuclease McrA